MSYTDDPNVVSSIIVDDVLIFSDMVNNCGKDTNIIKYSISLIEPAGILLENSVCITIAHLYGKWS